jgi:hypothetical protein
LPFLVHARQDALANGLEVGAVHEPSEGRLVGNIDRVHTAIWECAIIHGALQQLHGLLIAAFSRA